MSKHKTKRKIHIGQDVWTYRVGRKFINIWSPGGKRYNTTEADMTGQTPAEVERAYWKGCATGVRPSMVERWILDNHYGGKVSACDKTTVPKTFPPRTHEGVMVRPPRRKPIQE